jgi:ATP/ADP translocase/HEAT repeat protein
MATPTERLSLDALITGRARSVLSAFSESVLMVRPGEGRRTALLFTHLLLASAVFVMGRTVRDTLFLSRYSLAALPWMFVCYGVASAITVAFYARFADRLPRDRMIIIWSALGVVTYLGTWAAVRANAPWIYPVFYVWAEVFANLLISQFWTLANDLHDARSAKRLFGTIASARVLGVIVVGLSAGAIVKLVGTAQLIFVLAAMLVAIAVIAGVLGREPRACKAAASCAPSQRPARDERIMGEPYVNALALMMLFAFMALTLGDYQFKAIARATFKEDDLARFFSFFYAGTGIVSFLFQVLATPRLLARFGVGVGASVMPAVFGAASAVLLFVPHLGVATIMKFSDNGFQYTIHETTLQALYVPFAARVKARTRAFLDAVVKPLSYGAGGGLLIVLASRMPVERLSLVAVVLVAAWFATIPLVRRRYMSKLAATLSARGRLSLDEEPVFDGAGRQVLVQALASPDPRMVLAALEELGDVRAQDKQAALARIAADPEPSIRVAALGRMGGAGEAALSTVAPMLADPVPEVRAAAAMACASIGKDDVIELLSPLLDDPSETVRTAALAAMLGFGGFEGNLMAGARLVRLLDSEDPRERCDAADVLGAMGRGGVRLLGTLLADPELDVRMSALRAARSVADARLVARLVDLLSDRRCSTAAASALSAVGAPAVPSLAALLAGGATPRPVRLLVPRILREIKVQASYDALLAATGFADSRLRLRVFAALGRLRESLGLLPEPASKVRGWVEAETAETCVNMAAWKEAREAYPFELFEEETVFRYQGCVRRVLRILEMSYPVETIRLVRSRIEDPALKSNALEVLDTALDPSMRGLVMPFMDERQAMDRAGSWTLGRPVPPAAEFMRSQCRHPNPYVALLALEALAGRKDALAAEMGRELLGHPDPLVREGAVGALAASDPAAGGELRALVQDPDPMVARKARAALAPGGADKEDEKMYSTVEKILLLKRAPLFEKLPGDDLSPLARVAELETRAKGEVIFREGDMGDALYVVVRGRVEIRKGQERLAEFGPQEVFGEMAVLDASPRSATAAALEDTDMLRIGSEEFYEVLHERVDIAEGVIRMLTRRLREANREGPH